VSYPPGPGRPAPAGGRRRPPAAPAPRSSPPHPRLRRDVSGGGWRHQGV